MPAAADAPSKLVKLGEAKSLGVMDVGDLPINGQNNNLALNAINAPSAWAAGITGQGVTVAIIDAGIAYHSELADRIMGGYDFYDKDELPLPDSGVTLDHGLSVGAIIAASHSVHDGPDTMGVAPDASGCGIVPHWVSLPRNGPFQPFGTEARL